MIYACFLLSLGINLDLSGGDRETSGEVLFGSGGILFGSGAFQSMSEQVRFTSGCVGFTRGAFQSVSGLIWLGEWINLGGE
jgi:hypothetical protein